MAVELVKDHFHHQCPNCKRRFVPLTEHAICQSPDPVLFADGRDESALIINSWPMFVIG